MSLYKNLTDAQRQALTPGDKQILERAKELDERFEGQFERRHFDYIHSKEDIDYLPPEMKDDKYLVKDRVVALSYTYWPAQNGDVNAKTIFVLPGIYQGARNNDLFAEQASATANVVCLDYPGKDHSGGLYLPNDYTMRTYAKMTAALIEDVNPDNGFSIIGHSYGGKIVYTLIEQGFSHPQWESVVLGDMGPETPEKTKMAREWHPRGATSYETVTEALSGLQKFSRGHGVLPRDYLINAMNHGFRYQPRPGDAGYTWTHDGRAMQGYCDENHLPYDKWAAYKKIPVPILLLVGGKSDTVTPPVLERMLKERPDASLFMFRNTGHYPELFMHDHADHVVGWINKQQDGKRHKPVYIEIPEATAADRKAVPLQINIPPASPPARSPKQSPGPT